MEAFVENCIFATSGASNQVNLGVPNWLRFLVLHTKQLSGSEPEGFPDGKHTKKAKADSRPIWGSTCEGAWCVFVVFFACISWLNRYAKLKKPESRKGPGRKQEVSRKAGWKGNSVSGPCVKVFFKPHMYTGLFMYMALGVVAKKSVTKTNTRVYLFLQHNSNILCILLYF